MSWSIPRRITAIVVAILGILYPVLVYFGLSSYAPRYILLLLLAVIIVRAALFVASKKYLQAGLALLVAIIVGSAGIASEIVAIRFYPVIVAATLAAIFTVSLFSGMPIIERFARLREDDLDDYAQNYTRNLTKVWIGFFIVNGMIAAWTALYASLETWTLYNGLISYILVGILFVGEWPVRKWMRSRHDQKVKNQNPSQTSRTDQEPV